CRRAVRNCRSGWPGQRCPGARPASWLRELLFSFVRSHEGRGADASAAVSLLKALLPMFRHPCKCDSARMLLDISSLTPIQCPLLDKFYRAQRRPMRSGRAEGAWVARSGGEVVAGVCLTPVAHGYWLTGLLVAPAYRNGGLATALLGRLRAQVSGPIWLFCHPDLQEFYEMSGYR